MGGVRWSVAIAVAVGIFGAFLRSTRTRRRPPRVPAKSTRSHGERKRVEKSDEKRKREAGRKADDGKQGGKAVTCYVFFLMFLPRLSFLTSRMRVIPVPVRQDNYAYLLIDTPTNKAAAVDVYDVNRVSAAAQSLGVSIVAAITTHWHDDHSGGNHVRVVFPPIPLGLLNVPCRTLYVALSRMYYIMLALTEPNAGQKIPRPPDLRQ
jgi:hypothetical protein